MSHPLWMRGLKYFILSIGLEAYIVASFMDAWIEIVYEAKCIGLTDVASFMDAWIEIALQFIKF